MQNRFSPFSAAGFAARYQETAQEAAECEGMHGDHQLTRALAAEEAAGEQGKTRIDHLPRDMPEDSHWKKAAVLIPVVDTGKDARVLFTLRSSRLRNHSGQVSFPGGRIDQADTSPSMAALREAEEEIALDRRAVDVLGVLPPYYTGTGYQVKPVVAIVPDLPPLKANPDEVAAIFEVPLSFLMNPANHQRRFKEIDGQKRFYYAIPYQDYFIWGATAGMIRMLYERLYR